MAGATCASKPVRCAKPMGSAAMALFALKDSARADRDGRAPRKPRRRMSAAFLVAILAGCTACGEHVDVRIIVENASVQKERMGPAPAGVISSEYTPESGPGVGFWRIKWGDLIGDSQAEAVVEIGAGRGLDLRDRSGGQLMRIATDDYLTDFAISKAGGRAKDDLIVYTYPNANRAGTLSIRNRATPYHMVCVFENGELRFPETAHDNAFGLEHGPGDNVFDVLTRTTRWRYWIGSA